MSGFVVQILLFLGLFFVVRPRPRSDHGHVGDSSGLATIVLIVIAVIVVGGVVVMAVPAMRRRVVDGRARQARAALRVLRSPTKLLQLFGGNLVSQVAVRRRLRRRASYGVR